MARFIGNAETAVIFTRKEKPLRYVQSVNILEHILKSENKTIRIFLDKIAATLKINPNKPKLSVVRKTGRNDHFWGEP